jgi:hypothetical protein
MALDINIEYTPNAWAKRVMEFLRLTPKELNDEYKAMVVPEERLKGNLEPVVNINATGSYLTPELMHQLSLHMKSDKWKVVISPFTLAAYEHQPLSLGEFHSSFQPGVTPENATPEQLAKFCLMHVELAFPRDQVWLVDEDFFIVAKIVGLAVQWDTGEIEV